MVPLQCLASISYSLSSMSTPSECHHFLHISHSNPWSASPTLLVSYILHVPQCRFYPYLYFLGFNLFSIARGTCNYFRHDVSNKRYYSGREPIVEELRTTPLRPVADSAGALRSFKIIQGH